MKVLSEVYQLNTGFRIPKVGFGTYQIKGEACFRAVKTALEVGYKHLDTASLYGNESEVGRALQETDRNSIFLTTKVGPSQHGYETAYKTVQNSLRNLNTDYLDLVLIHWPGSFKCSASDQTQVNLRHQTWRALEALQAEGKVRSIGVSNFLIHHLEKLLQIASVTPSVNQIENHPMCYEQELIEFCQNKGILIESYSPLARTDDQLWNHPFMNEVSQKYQKTKSQILVRWGLQKNTVVLPKSQTPERIVENVQVDFELQEEDILKLQNIAQKRTCWNPHSILV